MFGSNDVRAHWLLRVCIPKSPLRQLLKIIVSVLDMGNRKTELETHENICSYHFYTSIQLAFQNLRSIFSIRDSIFRSCMTAEVFLHEEFDLLLVSSRQQTCSTTIGIQLFDFHERVRHSLWSFCPWYVLKITSTCEGTAPFHLPTQV